MDLRECFLTGCYSGLLPKAPGTWGTVVGLGIGWVILQFLPQSTLFLLAILVTVVAIKEIDRYEAKTKIHDAPKIVIDEIAGIWFALSILPNTHPLWMGVAFLLFRYFDITKPSIVGKAENLKGGLGVMADDIVAGILAGLATGIIYVGVMKVL